jgi:hypothetical protein
MCSYYDPSPRADNPSHVGPEGEKWDDQHRARMTALIPSVPHPVIHYKVFAGGNRSIQEGFEFLAQQMRPRDMVCIGYYLADNPNMIAENVATFESLID